MSNFTTLYNTSSLPIGTVARGSINDPTWLPMDGGLYLKSDYPQIDTSEYLTFGNNTFQTGLASGLSSTISSSGFAHNADYSKLIIYGNNGNFHLQSSDGGITWMVRSNPVATAIAHVNFINNMFVLVHTNASIYTSLDGITWTSAGTAPSFSGPPGGIGMFYVNGLYVIYGNVGTSAFGIYTSPTIVSPTWTARDASSGSSNINMYSNASNKKPTAYKLNGVYYLTQYFGSDTEYYFIATIDGINYSRVAKVNSQLAVTRFSDYDILYSTAGLQFNLGELLTTPPNFSIYPTQLSESGGQDITSGLNFYAWMTSNGSSTRVAYSESKFASRTSTRTLPSPLTGGSSIFFTPNRMIVIGYGAGQPVYYLNVDTTRFRLERPYMDDRIVEDAYIKVA